jgi:hypothetical protein
MASSYVRVGTPNLSRAWLRTLNMLATPRRRDAIPLVVSFSAFTEGEPDEVLPIRERLDQVLVDLGKPSVSTVANTIFPKTLWDKSMADQSHAAEIVYSRYLALLPRISRYPANRNGIYFARMMAYHPAHSPDEPTNQIRHVINTYRRGNHRRSALQLSIFDPTRDHTHQRQRGFPCLHQIALSPKGDRLALTAFYGTQHILTRAYGNYLGLARLGAFLAGQLAMRIVKVTCIASVGALGAPQTIVRPLIEDLEHRL